MQAFRILCCVVLALLCTRPVRAQPTLTPPELLAGEPPAVPAAMKLAAETAVEVELTVDEQGATKDVALITSSGHTELDALALEAARALRFAPATRDGAAIAARIPFRFTFAPAPAPTPPAAPVPAPTPTPTPPTSQPVPIVLDVLGERPPREATAHVISAEQARTLPGSNGDPLRAVENMPGVGRPPGLNGDLIVRGSAPQDSVIFIDGIAVPGAYHFGGLSSVIPTEALDRIDFRPGNFGPEYGRAMGGVVELGMRSPRSDRYSGLVQVDSIDGRFLLQGPLGKRTRFLIAGRRSWLDAWLPHVLNDDDVAFKSAPVYYDGQLVLEHDLTRRTTARLFLFGSDDRMALLIKSPDGQDPSEGGRLAARNSFLRLGLRLNTRFNDAVSLTNMLSWGPERSSFVFGIDSFDFTVQQFAWRSELRARLHRSITAAAGIDLTASRYDMRLYVRPYPATDEVDGPDFARPSRLFVDEIWLFRPAVYALLELTPLDGLRLMPSVRVDYTHDTGKVTADPRLAMRAVLHDGPYRTTFKAGVGLFHQPPQGVESVSPYGTPGVRSNRSIHSSAGFEQQFMPGLSLSLEGFYKHYSDLVVSVPDEDGSPVGARFENRGSGRAYGSEFLLRYQGDGRFHGWLSYTLSRSERRNQPDEPLHLFEWDQTHILSALGSVDVGAGFTLGARFRFVSGTPYTPYVGGIVDLDAGAYAAVPTAESYSARLPSFQQLDLRVDKTFKIRSGRLIAYLELRNAYNRKNTEQISYRFDYAQAKRESGLPILPVIGLRGEL
jgi:TonB family protein